MGALECPIPRVYTVCLRIETKDLVTLQQDER
jgi:sugar-specific transcriptional regulator TrmB